MMISLSNVVELLNVSYGWQKYNRGTWVSVATAWRVLRFRIDERPSIWRIAANILNKQWRTADTGWSSSLGVGRVANNS